MLVVSCSTALQGLASIALTPTSSIAASGTPGSRTSSLLRRTPLTPSTAGTAAGSGSGGLLGSPLARGSPSPLQELSLSSSRATALIAAGGTSPLAPAGDSLVGVTQPVRGWLSPAAAAAQQQQTVQQAGMEVQDSAPAPGLVEFTPPVTRRSVRFADTVQPGSSSRGRLRMGTPYSAAAAFDLGAEEEEGEEEAVASAASPVVASCRRSPLGRAPPGASPLPPAAWQRSPLAPMQSAAKPHHPGAVYGLDAGSSEDEEVEVRQLFGGCSDACGLVRLGHWQRGMQRRSAMGNWRSSAASCPPPCKRSSLMPAAWRSVPSAPWAPHPPRSAWLARQQRAHPWHIQSLAVGPLLVTTQRRRRGMAVTQPMAASGGAAHPPPPCCPPPASRRRARSSCWLCAHWAG